MSDQIKAGDKVTIKEPKGYRKRFAGLVGDVRIDSYEGARWCVEFPRECAGRWFRNPTTYVWLAPEEIEKVSEMPGGSG
jgi:hypothetical protein